MGLSRNKVAVSEGAAGSPPFYGESERVLRKSFIFGNRQNDGEIGDRTLCTSCCSIFEDREILKHAQGGVAQLGEHLPCKQGVRGSNPLISTKWRERMREEHTGNNLRAHSSAG